VNVDMGDGQALAQLDKQSGQLSELAPSPPASWSRQLGEAFYWVDGPQTGLASSNLLRARLPELEPEVVHQIQGGVFDVGPGYVLWRQGVVEDERLAVLGQNFVLLNEATGCVQEIPGIGETISFRPALDATYAYWQRSVAGYAGDSPALPLTPLYRTNLREGTTELLETPGLSLELGSWIVGQDQDEIFIATESGLVAIAKP